MATDRQDAVAIAETLRTGLFPALQEVAEQALATAQEAARQRTQAEEQARQECVAGEKAEAARRTATWHAEGRLEVDAATFSPREGSAQPPREIAYAEDPRGSAAER